MSFFADLRSRSSAWTRAVDHRFVNELWAGTVSPAVMRRYLVQVRGPLPQPLYLPAHIAPRRLARHEAPDERQDAQFLDGFVRLLGAAVACSDLPASRIWLGKQLGFICSGAANLFLAFADV